MSQYDFKIVHIAHSVNTAADFISRLDIKVTETIRLKYRKDKQTTPIEVTTSSSNVAGEEKFLSTQSGHEKGLEEQTL